MVVHQPLIKEGNAYAAVLSGESVCYCGATYCPNEPRDYSKCTIVKACHTWQNGIIGEKQCGNCGGPPGINKRGKRIFGGTFG